MSLRTGVIVTVWGLSAAMAGSNCLADDTKGAASARRAEAEIQEIATPDEQVAALETMCGSARAAMEARQEERSLFDRVGGREGLHEVVADTVRRHGVNPRIKHFLAGVDPDLLVERVTDFLVLGTGGEGEYHGRDMVAAHAHLHLDNADFLAAGSDLGASMDAAGWGENEKQELLCAFVELRPQVVTR